MKAEKMPSIESVDVPEEVLEIAKRMTAHLMDPVELQKRSIQTLLALAYLHGLKDGYLEFDRPGVAQR